MSTANWLEVHSDLSDHPKVRFCAELLKIDPDLLVGKLLRLWTWALNNREDGRFLSCEVSMIAEKMRWLKKPERLIDALCVVAPDENAGFLVRDETGYSIYHWQEYAGKLIVKRERDRARKAASHSTESQNNSNGIPSEIQRNKRGNSAEFQRSANGIPGVTLNPLPLTTKLSGNNSSCGFTGERAPAREEPPPQPPINPDFGNVLGRYEQILGTFPSAILREDIKAYLDAGMAPEVLCEAVDETARAAAQSPAAYFKSVAGHWLREGVRDTAGLQTFKQREQQSRPPARSSPRPSLPDISDPGSYRAQTEEDLPSWAREPLPQQAAKAPYRNSSTKASAAPNAGSR